MSTDPNHVVIIDYLRTPFAKASGKVPGRLGDVAPVDLLVPLINGLIDRTGIDPSKVKKVLTGCVAPESVQGMNIAREAVMHADSKLPDSVAGTTLDMFCASSMDAIAMAAGRVKMNPNGVYIASGVQSMSQVPMGGHNFMPHPKLDRTNSIPNEYLKNYHFMPATAENLARRGSISREAQDAFAMRSNQRLAAATKAGRLKDEIQPIKGLDYDDGVREDTNMEGLAKLKPINKDGTITAGNSSQITDGASAVMVSSEAFARENSLPVLARVLAVGEAGCEPHLMGRGPVPASIEALELAGLKMEDIDIIEINEAFAAQVLSCMKEWEELGMPVNPDKINVNGGAIAMGHPLGASGARITGTLARELQRANKRYGMATLCVGSGQGMAIILENPNFTPEL